MMHDLAPIDVAAVWAGLLMLVLVVLSVRVMLQRRKHRVSLGDGGVENLAVAGRAFGNASEYIPAGIVGLILMSFVGAPVWALHAVGAALFVGRIVHPIGLGSRGNPRPGRILGMILTWSALIAAALTLVIRPLLF